MQPVAPAAIAIETGMSERRRPLISSRCIAGDS